MLPAEANKGRSKRANLAHNAHGDGAQHSHANSNHTYDEHIWVGEKAEEPGNLARNSLSMAVCGGGYVET